MSCPDDSCAPDDGIATDKAGGDGCSGNPAPGCPDHFIITSSIAAGATEVVDFAPPKAFRITHIVLDGSHANISLTDYQLHGRKVLPTPVSESEHTHSYPTANFSEESLDRGLNRFPAYVMPKNGIDKNSRFGFEMTSSDVGAQNAVIEIFGRYVK